MIKDVLVVGAGSAGLMAALALKKKIPQLNVRVVRSHDIGIIGVGESTTPQYPQFLFEYLGLSRKFFYAVANPTWKLGIHFLWGPRGKFNYTFDPQLDLQYSDLPEPNGYYCDDEFCSLNLNSALMAERKAFEAQPNDGGPIVPNYAAFHLFNPHLVKALEQVGTAWGIEFIEGKINGVEMGEPGVTGVVLEDGRRLTADFFVDATGFRSELLGKAMGTPFVSYANSLFNDRAMVGSWERGPEDFIEPYTVAETMDAGWCWQIDHEHAVNRGYVYSSRFISDDEAHAEFKRKNPKAKTWDRPLKFASGRYEKGWVKNVFGIGNASAFVEPLESTALMVACSQIQTMVSMLKVSHLRPGTELLALYNRCFADWWDGIRDFLALHFRFNTLLSNPYWTTCNNEADVSGSADFLAFYRENGPCGYGRHLLKSTVGTDNQFGIEGFLTMMVGMKVPYEARHQATPQERAIFRRHVDDFRAVARRSMTAAEALRYVKHPGWEWFSDRPQQQQPMPDKSHRRTDFSLRSPALT